MPTDLSRAVQPLKLFIVLGSLAVACGAPTPKSDAPVSEERVPKLKVIAWQETLGQDWKEFDRLVGEQKFEQAAKIIEPRLKSAIAAKDSELWVRALLRAVKLRTALHGYEKAVRYLKEQPWPRDLLGHTVLHLYYAAALVNYANSYSWEIRQREQISSKGKVDLKAWTWDQIHTEAQRAYDAVWVHRGQLGGQPVKHLSEHLTLNDFPRDIRPTLRDAVSYLRVQLLNNTAGWRPEHTNELYRLDLPALMGGKPRSKAAPERVALADPEVHPLIRLSAILLDLERWHLGKKEEEAAFEARLTLLRALHDHLSQSSERKLIADDLRARLPALRKLPWWSMGMAALSGFVRVENTPDKLIRAREIAIQGHQAYPESIGGKRCLSIYKSIELPSYRMEAMTSDGPQKRSIGIEYKNLRRVYFRAYPIDLQRIIERSKDYNLLPRNRELKRLLKHKKPSHQWDAALPQTIDYDTHRVDVTAPMSVPGTYVVIASARRDFAKRDNFLTGTYLAIGDLVMIVRTEQSGKLYVDVRSGSTGNPVSGVRVKLYRLNYQKGHKVITSAVTPRDGTVIFSKISPRQNHFLMAQKGAHVALDPQHRSVYRTKYRKRSATLIYTDRSIYRPLQKIHFKAVLYRGHPKRADYKVEPGARVTIKLMDPNHQEVAKKTLTANSFGTVSGDFEIPQGRLLGQWHLKSSRNGRSYFRVEEYKRPTFEVKIPGSKAPLRLNKPAVFKGEARYLFGLPVTSGAVTWRVTRTPVYPWWFHYYRWSRGVGSSRTQTVASGKAELTEDGTFSISFTPEADERSAKVSKDISYRYHLTADVTDEGGESRTASRGFRLGFVAVEAAISADVNFYLAQQGGQMTVQRTNLDGVASPGAGRYRLVRLKMPPRTLLPVEQPQLVKAGSLEAFSTPDDKKRKRWAPSYNVSKVLRGWTDGPEQARGKLTHDKTGAAKVSLPRLSSGAYRLHYTTKDAFGAQFAISKEFVVAGPKQALALPAYAWVEKSSAKVGQRARLFVGSGLSSQPIIVDFFRGGIHTERRTLRSGRDGSLIEIPITERHRGGFGVVVTALRDHQLMQFQSTIFVPWDNKELDVSFSTFRDRLRPGSKEKWTVKVTGPAGKKTPAKAAEVLAYMYDRSLDLITPHHTPSPLALFPHRTAVAWSSATLGPGRIIYLDHKGFAGAPDFPALRPDALKFWSGHGIGGLGVRSFSKRFHRGLRVRPRSRPPPSLPQREPAPQPSVQKKNKLGSTAASTTESDDSGLARIAGPLPVSGASKPAQMRQNFSETAFFEPHLLTGADGSVSFEFEVPDSVTSWNVWAHAITRDLQSGAVKKETRSVKELMVRPYLPRFLREGDKATIKVVVNNASKATIKGQLKFDIIDPRTKKSLLKTFGLKKHQAAARPFTVKAEGGTNLSFPIVTPAKVGLVAFRVVATSKDFSDGELRPIPILPGRIHLAQSRFVTLKDKERRELHFADLKRDDDPSRINEQMVVTIDAQLFYSVLSALPYLVNYPYECTEQTLNRFVSTGILSSMYKDYPAIEKMARTFAARKTRLERWDQSDPNRKMALEETPWLQAAQGGGESDASPLVNVLDPRITLAQRNASLAKLYKAQTSLGGFPWFSGGPPSPYMTLYILYGLSKGLEFKVDVPQEVVQRSWRYLHRHYVDHVVANMMKDDCCWEFVTFLNYTLSSYPDSSWTGGVFTKAERRKMLNFSFRHWKDHSPYLTGYLALTLHRRGRAKDARLVWESVMDSAKSARDQGTFWAPEARSWLWYNDTIETHAFAIRTELELRPKSGKLDGLVLWIFLNKKLNHWKSTRATAEVIYSLAKYLKQTAQLGQREAITVTVGDLKRDFVFTPDTYTGKKNQVVIAGKQLNPKKHSTVVVEKKTKGAAFASATWHFSTERLPKEARGGFLAVNRKYFLRVKTGRVVKLTPLKEGARVEVGAEVEVQLSLKAKHPMEYVHLRDPRPAGFEPTSATSRHRWNLGLYWYEEIRDSGANFFFERLPQGEYPFKYRLRATTAGTFKAAPATVQPMYAPEFTGYSAGRTIKIHPVK